MMTCVPEQHRGRYARAPLVWRIAKRIDRRGPDECWPWTGTRLKSGAAMLAKGGGKATRALWALIYGPIPPGMCVLHSCDNPPCMNARHWFLGTQLDNIADMKAKGRARNRHTKALGAIQIAGLGAIREFGSRP